MYQLTNSKIYKLYSAFISRHIFQDQDLQLLKDKYPNVEFSNIPKAWILSIDQMLEDIYNVEPNLKLSVKQVLGFLVVDKIPHDPQFSFNYEYILKNCEKMVYQLDLDLHADVGYKFYWVED